MEWKKHVVDGSTIDAACAVDVDGEVELVEEEPLPGTYSVPFFSTNGKQGGVLMAMIYLIKVLMKGDAFVKPPMKGCVALSLLSLEWPTLTKVILGKGKSTR